jgi:flagellar export protein FliJ
VKKLEFRLQKVLDYRRMAEEWAKDAFLEAHAKRIAGEAVLQSVLDHRKILVAQPVSTLHDRLALQGALDKTDDDERAQLAVLEVLAADEATAMEDWQRARRDVQIIEKLREKAVEEWEYDLARYEQSELDEWTITRRAA